MKRLGRKGSIWDFFGLLFVFLVMGIVLVVSIYLKDAIFPQLTIAFGADSEASGVVQTSAQGFTMMDNLFLVMFFLLNGMAIVFAAMVPNHPAFLVMNIILMLILFIIAPMFSNVMQQFWSTPTMAVYAEGGAGSVTFPIMTRMFQYMPAITLGLSIILMIVQYSKGGSQGGY